MMCKDMVDQAMKDCGDSFVKSATVFEGLALEGERMGMVDQTRQSLQYYRSR